MAETCLPQVRAAQPRPLLFRLRLCVALACVSAAAACPAQTFPARPVTLVVPLSTGSATDGMVRILAQKLSVRWGTGVAVVNKPGGTGMIGAAFAANAAPDGYTLVAVSTSQVIATHLNEKLPVDFHRDLRPVARMGSVPLVLCARTALNFHSVNDLVAAARARPGELNYGSPGRGTTTHLAAELFAKAAGIRLTHVPYSAVSQAQTDISAGQLDLLFMIPGVAKQLSDGHRADCLVTDSPSRLAQFPQLPTMREAGFHAFDVDDWIALAAPAGTPTAIVDKLSADVVEALKDPDTVQKISNLGVLVRPMSVQQFSVLYREDFPRWGETLKKLGIGRDTN